MELLQQGLAVTVIERSAYDDLRIGEHVQPSAVLKLRTIGSKSNLRLDGHFASAGVIAYWGSESANFMDYFLHAASKG